MIHSITLKNLRNAEYINFIDKVLQVVSNNNPAALNVEAQHTHLQEQYKDLNNLFKLAQGNPITQELVRLDQQRDDALLGLFYVATAHTYHLDATTQRAANTLLETINKYGNSITNMNYFMQTATVKSLVDDLKTITQVQEAVQKLQANYWVAVLENFNNQFRDKYLERSAENADKSPENLKSLRKEADQGYYKLRDRLTSLWILAEQDDASSNGYTTLVNQLNNLIKEYNELLSNRSKATPKEEEDPTQEATES